jgi:hypothetical protein
MTERELQIALAGTLLGFVFAALILFGHDLLWRVRQARRAPVRRGGSIFQERR